MLLTENIVKQVNQFGTLKLCSVNIEKVTNTYYRVYLQLNNILVRLDVEENDFYISFLIIHKKEDAPVVYYALSDYSDCSDIIGIKQPIFTEDSEESALIKRVKKCISNHKKSFTKDKHGDELVFCILSFINEFIAKL